MKITFKAGPFDGHEEEIKVLCKHLVLTLAEEIPDGASTIYIPEGNCTVYEQDSVLEHRYNFVGYAVSRKLGT